MDERKGQDTKTSSPSMPPRLPRSYNLLIRLSRSMGNVATQSSLLQDVRSFMSSEISLSPSERMFGNTFPKVTVTRPDEPAPKVPASVPSSKKAQREKDLKKIVSQSHEVLMSANTVFPLTLFPDTITIDRTKVTITRRDFFWSSDVLSIRIEDVLNVQATVGPLFGSLTVASRVMSTVDHFQIRHLWRGDSLRLKQIIQGYVIAQHNKIDTSHLRKKELIETLIELGHDSI